MAMKYMNKFAIGEEDQFEIHFKIHEGSSPIGNLNLPYGGYEVTNFYYNAVKEAILKAQQGLGYNCL